MYISASAPDAPPLSDTTIGCFIRLFFWIAACIILAIWSEAPPAPAATTISTGFVGSHATAGAAVSANKASVLHLPNFMTPPQKEVPPPFSSTGYAVAKKIRPPCAALPARSRQGDRAPRARRLFCAARRRAQIPFQCRRGRPPASDR